jgi:hypothetical protein
MLRRTAPWFAIAMSTFVACKGKSEEPSAAAPTAAPGAMSTTAAAAAPAGRTTCDITVTGDATASWKGVLNGSVAQHDGRAGVSTDYWFTDDELRTILRTTMRTVDRKKSETELDSKLEAAMKQDPRFMLLMINCIADAGSLTLSASPRSTYADIPYRPGTYTVRKTSDAKPGELTAMFSIKGNDTAYRVASGSVAISKFDGTGLTGSLKLELKSFDGSKTVHVTGNLDYPCFGMSRCAP